MMMWINNDLTDASMVETKSVGAFSPASGDLALKSRNLAAKVSTKAFIQYSTVPE